MRQPKPMTKDEKWLAVMKKTRGRCYYCGYKGWPQKEGEPLAFMTIDHIVAKRWEGSDEIENLVPACKACNSAKCAGTIEDLRHSTAQRLLAMPSFTRPQIAWVRKQGADLSKYDGFKFWFEKVAQKSARNSGVSIDKIGKSTGFGFGESVL